MASPEGSTTASTGQAKSRSRTPKAARAAAAKAGPAPHLTKVSEPAAAQEEAPLAAAQQWPGAAGGEGPKALGYSRRLSGGTLFHVLRVTIVSARGLRNADVGTGVSDPYCLCEVYPKPLPRQSKPSAKGKFKTPVLNETLNPVWNHKVEITGFSADDVLAFSVWDKDTITADDLLGRTTLDSKDMLPTGYRGELPLVFNTGKPGTSTAFLCISVDLIRTYIVSKAEKLSIKNVAKDEDGDRPTEVTVHILSARNLRNTDWVPGTGISDPYCICEVPGKPKSRLRTGVAMDTLHPVWNFKGKITEWTHSDALVFTVMDKDICKPDDFLGRATLTSEQLLPVGFRGDLKLQSSGNALATLKVKVMLQEISEFEPFAPDPEVAEDTCDRSEALLKAAESGDVQMVKQLLNKGAPLDATNDEGLTALHIATINCHEDVVGRLLLQGGKKRLLAAKTAVEKDTALHLAARDDTRAIAVMLVREGASLRSKNSTGKVPADLAKGPLQTWMRGSDPAGTTPPWQK